MRAAVLNCRFRMIISAFSSIEAITQATEGSPLVGNPLLLRMGSGQKFTIKSGHSRSAVIFFLVEKVNKAGILHQEK
ncbi:MAG: hypothetical protein WBZ33_04430 [Thermoactinomyces sp.]